MVSGALCWVTGLKMKNKTDPHEQKAHTANDDTKSSSILEIPSPSAAPAGKKQ